MELDKRAKQYQLHLEMTDSLEAAEIISDLLKRIELLERSEKFHLEYIKSLGVSSDTCVKHVTKETCDNCRCQQHRL